MTRMAASLVGGQVSAEHKALTGDYLCDIFPGSAVVRPVLGGASAVNARVSPRRSAVDDQSLVHRSVTFGRLAPRDSGRSPSRFQHGIVSRDQRFASTFVRQGLSGVGFGNLPAMIFGQGRPSLGRREPSKVLRIFSTPPVREVAAIVSAAGAAGFAGFARHEAKHTVPLRRWPM